MSENLESPVSVKAKASYKVIKTILDSTELERFQSRVVEMGLVRKKKFLIICDGCGNIKIRELKKWTDKLKELEKMKKYMRKEQYEKIKKNILDDVSN